jgi:hypothetical protein
MDAVLLVQLQQDLQDSSTAAAAAAAAAVIVLLQVMS